MSYLELSIGVWHPDDVATCLREMNTPSKAACSVVRVLEMEFRAGSMCSVPDRVQLQAWQSARDVTILLTVYLFQKS